MDFEYSAKTKELQARLQKFMDDHIYPNEATYKKQLRENTEAGKRWRNHSPTLRGQRRTRLFSVLRDRLVRIARRQLQQRNDVLADAVADIVGMP